MNFGGTETFSPEQPPRRAGCGIWTGGFSLSGLLLWSRAQRAQREGQAQSCWAAELLGWEQLGLALEGRGPERSLGGGLAQGVGVCSV